MNKIKKKNMYIILLLITGCSVLFFYLLFLQEKKEIIIFSDKKVEDWPYVNINFPSIQNKINEHVTSIAIIDTGIETKNTCLNNMKIEEYKLSGIEDIDNKHGNIITAAFCNSKFLDVSLKNNILLRNNLKLYSIDVGTDKNIQIDTLKKGLSKAIEKKVDIINLSVGTYKNDSELKELVKKAIDSGIIIITSAGNDMTKQDLYPSVYPGVITVTSLDKENNYLYTNNFNDHITISAPGVDISTSLVDKEKNEITLSGTSASSVLVSSLIVLLKTIDPDLKSQDLLDIFSKTSDDIGKAGKDPHYGYGIINVKRIFEYMNNN